MTESLNTTCFSIERGADNKLLIAAGTLLDFASEIETTTRRARARVGDRYCRNRRGLPARRA